MIARPRLPARRVVLENTASKHQGQRKQNCRRHHHSLDQARSKEHPGYPAVAIRKGMQRQERLVAGECRESDVGARSGRTREFVEQPQNKWQDDRRLALVGE